MKKKIYLSLIGGLGNQLFQYACGSNLAYKSGSKLIIDDYNGFVFDKVYKRKLSLPKKLIKNKVNLKEILFLFFLKSIKKIFYKNKVLVKIFDFLIVDETITNSYIKNFENIILKEDCNIYLIGFFQSENYFRDNKNKIVKKIMNSLVKNNNLEKAKKKISSSSVMVGVRMYEDAPLRLKKLYGGIESYNFYNKSISFFKKKLKNSKIFFFSTLKDRILIKKKIEHKIDYFNFDEKYNLNNFETLMLLSNFKNFVISNSSYYWWAAYLSRAKTKAKVVSSKKFINKSSILKGWKIDI